MKDGSISVDEILNAVPIIDGNIATMEDLKSFGLHRSAGTTKEMNQATVEMVHENLAEMTQLTKMMQSITGLVDAEGTNIGEFKMNGEMYTMAKAKQRFIDLVAENKIFGQLSPAEILELSGGNATSGIISADGTTASQTDLKVTNRPMGDGRVWNGQRWVQPPNVNITTIAPVDASSVTTIIQNYNAYEPILDGDITPRKGGISPNTWN